jgi:hypothetical protein
VLDSILKFIIGVELPKEVFTSRVRWMPLIIEWNAFTNIFYLLKYLLLLILVMFKLKCNNLIFNKIMALNVSYVCLHAFSLRRESLNSDSERRTPHFMLSQWLQCSRKLCFWMRHYRVSPETNLTSYGHLPEYATETREGDCATHTYLYPFRLMLINCWETSFVPWQLWVKIMSLLGCNASLMCYLVHYYCPLAV